mmetsp:Transcript_24259/g.61739  ORF Transcript_24259/g.61739 Transcript_24259/m.61739 type:complete len:213 (-) Transcript_24259:248-886(-)
MLKQLREGGPTGERELLGQLVDDHPKAPDVTREGAALPQHSLGAHVQLRPHVGHRDVTALLHVFGQPEIGELDFTLAVDQHVVGLDVSMNGPKLVQALQTVQSLLGDACQMVFWNSRASRNSGAQCAETAVIHELQHNANFRRILLANVRRIQMDQISASLRLHQRPDVAEHLGSPVSITDIHELDSQRGVAGHVHTLEHGPTRTPTQSAFA